MSESFTRVWLCDDDGTTWEDIFVCGRRPVPGGVTRRYGISIEPSNGYPGMGIVEVPAGVSIELTT